MSLLFLEVYEHLVLFQDFFGVGRSDIYSQSGREGATTGPWCCCLY